MTRADFEVIAPAKWILAGEHAVLRGHPALVFPIPNKFVRLSYCGGNHAMEMCVQDPYADSLRIFLSELLDMGLKLLNKSRSELLGTLTIENNVPMGSGIGFSAAFCTSIAQWFLWKGWLKSPYFFEFARRLEDYFHGKSSGVDIAGSLSKQGACFTIDGSVTQIECHWKPHVYLSHSGTTSLTQACIKTVKQLWQVDPEKAHRIDEDMRSSVFSARRALRGVSASCIDTLAKAIQRANTCFDEWGLVNPEMTRHMNILMEEGAIAVKPTGAGNGGYILSLWREKPPSSAAFELIPCFDE